MRKKIEEVTIAYESLPHDEQLKLILHRRANRRNIIRNKPTKKAAQKTKQKTSKTITNLSDEALDKLLNTAKEKGLINETK